MSHTTSTRWLVEQMWNTDDSVLLIRSIVRASNRRIAERRAPRAIQVAVEILAGKLTGKAAGEVHVLRRVALDFTHDVRRIQ